MHVGRCVLKVLVCRVRHSTHEQDGTWKMERKAKMSPSSVFGLVSETKTCAVSRLRTAAFCRVSYSANAMECNFISDGQ